MVCLLSLSLSFFFLNLKMSMHSILPFLGSVRLQDCDIFMAFLLLILLQH
uniref:Uncharacterized protein n=1 Tax=Rhizophora mucronata TaxID=61149 RepID=A0A2P2R3C3_RHIMU